MYSTSNQDPIVQDELATAEKMVAELKKLRQEVESLRNQTKLFQETLDLYKSLETIRTQQVEILKAAIKDRDSLSVLGTQKEELYKQELSLLKAENERLQKELNNTKRTKLLSKVANALLTVGVVFAATR